MIKFNEIKVGDYVLAEYDGQKREGVVTHLNGDEKEVCVETDVQQFYYEPQHVYPIPLTDEAMKSLHFTSETLGDGSVKYKKGSFRMMIPKKDDFSTIELWCREDRRHNPDVRYVHQLQNFYLAMTKIHLNKEVMV